MIPTAREGMMELNGNDRSTKGVIIQFIEKQRTSDIQTY